MNEYPHQSQSFGGVIDVLEAIGATYAIWGSLAVIAYKVDFYVPHEPYLKAMIAERVYQPFDQIRNAAYVTATSLVIAKFRAFADSQSTRHLEDIGSIIRIQKTNLDEEKIEVAAAQLGLLREWRRLWEENRG